MDLQEEVRRIVSSMALPFTPGSTEEVSSGEVEAFRTEFGIAIPGELSDWLSVCNGSYIGPGGTYGIGWGKFLDIASHLRKHPSWAQKKWIPVAGDGLGNHYVLDCSVRLREKSPVLFIDHEGDEDSSCYIFSSGLWEFLLVVASQQAGDSSFANWPFLKEKVVSTDPDLLLYEGVFPMPW